MHLKAFCAVLCIVSFCLITSVKCRSVNFHSDVIVTKFGPDDEKINEVEEEKPGWMVSESF